MEDTYQSYLYELERAKMVFKMLLEEEMSEKLCVRGVLDHIKFVNVGTNNKIEMGVSIISPGNVSATDAISFARCIEIAAKIAEDFKYNGYIMAYGISG